MEQRRFLSIDSVGQVQQRPRVLLVEDDPDTLAATATTLRETDDLEVWVARSGEQALEVAEELGFNADVVVVDLNLGPGMSGERFVAVYREHAVKPPKVIVLSGIPGVYDVARRMGAATTLPKPYDHDDLARRVRILAPRPFESKPDAAS